MELGTERCGRERGGLNRGSNRAVTLDLPVTAVLTDNGREFCGSERHPYELYLDLNGIEHRRTRVKSPKTNGFVERLNGTVLEEFFRVKIDLTP